MIDIATIPIEDQIAELKRELAMRKNVYERWVTNGILRPEVAERQMARMTAALHTLFNVHAVIKGGQPRGDEAVKDKKPRYSYDPECEKLAEYFLPSDASERMVLELSQAIQDCIESWMGYEMVRLQAETDGP